MVTYNVILQNAGNVILQNAGGGKHYVEGVCLAADTKPTDIANGSKLIEMDTGKLYIFDAAGETWREI